MKKKIINWTPELIRKVMFHCHFKNVDGTWLNPTEKRDVSACGGCPVYTREELCDVRVSSYLKEGATSALGQDDDEEWKEVLDEGVERMMKTFLDPLYLDLLKAKELSDDNA